MDERGVVPYYNNRMVIHTFYFRWKPATTPAEKQRAQTEIRALQGQIPGLLETLVGVNFSPRSQGYELGGIMKFADRAALESYADHPVHQKLLSWLKPLIDPVELDFEA
ncbi:MAG: Dabb family protein [Acidobacteriota bacterium]|nr:Dabb family protein [Acidobacteriota bacterium]